MAELPSNDPAEAERLVRAAIRDTFASVAGVGHVYDRVRLPDEGNDEELKSTIPDPVTETPLLNIAMVTFNGPSEDEYTDDTHTELILDYSISFDLGFVDRWVRTSGPVLEFDNSTDLFNAIMMRARRAFKDNRTLGYEGVVHHYLRADGSAALITDEDTGGRQHAVDFSLRVVVTGGTV